MDTERAETYLRLLAETELRHALTSGVGQVGDGVVIQVPAEAWEYLGRVQQVAAALTAVGAIDADVAESVTGDLEAALAVRSRVDRSSLIPHLTHTMAQARPARPQPPAAAAPGGAASESTATSVGRMFRLRREGIHADLLLLSLIRGPDTAMLAVAGSVQKEERPGVFNPPFGQVEVMDDLGTSYDLDFIGGARPGKADGWIWLRPALAASVRWIELSAGPQSSRLRVDVTAGPTPAEATVEPAELASPSERLLDEIAENMLARLPHPHPVNGQDEIVRALEATELLPPGSTAASRLAAVCQRTGSGSSHGLVSAMLAGTLPPADLPERWASMLAHFGRRHRPPGKEGAVPLAVVLPEIDGARFVLAGISSDADQTLLTVQATGLPTIDHHFPPGLGRSPWFRWWLRDSAGHWHLTTAGTYSENSGLVTAELRLVPPLPRSASWLDLVITGVSERIRATVPLNWMAADD